MAVKKAVILNSGEYEEVPSGDYLDNIAGAVLTTVKDDDTTLNDIDTLNFTGSVNTELNGDTVKINIQAGGSTEKFVQTIPYLKNIDDEIQISPFKFLLPDKNLVSKEDVFKLDLNTSGDLESSYTFTGDQWLYIYATDESSWSTKKAFISLTKPSTFGHHPTLNARFIGSCYLDSSINIRDFRKLGKFNLFASSEKAYEANAATGYTSVDLASYIPPITNIVLCYPHFNSTGNHVSFVHGVKYDDSYKDIICESGNSSRYNYAFVKTSSDREVWIRSSTSSTIDQRIFVNGYIENIFYPLQGIT